MLTTCLRYWPLDSQYMGMGVCALSNPCTRILTSKQHQGPALLEMIQDHSSSDTDWNTSIIGITFINSWEWLIYVVTSVCCSGNYHPTSFYQGRNNMFLLFVLVSIGVAVWYKNILSKLRALFCNNLGQGRDIRCFFHSFLINSKLCLFHMMKTASD